MPSCCAVCGSCTIVIPPAVLISLRPRLPSVPLPAGIAPKNFLNASSPPAEAPIPTTGQAVLGSSAGRFGAADGLRFIRRKPTSPLILLGHKEQEPAKHDCADARPDRDVDRLL